jgi:hypothetical protein
MQNVSDSWDRTMDLVIKVAASLGIEPSSTEINSLPARLVHY